ncbi:hypothetical protein OH77DRAFT_67238 [Trametes cingulata]|nr:hypothetical protein OH77DRAFT_67238 [Trametes cingulata]
MNSGRTCSVRRIVPACKASLGMQSVVAKRAGDPTRARASREVTPRGAGGHGHVMVLSRHVIHPTTVLSQSTAPIPRGARSMILNTPTAVQTPGETPRKLSSGVAPAPQASGLHRNF